MSKSTKTNVGKLLRVLVAGGVGLAGVAGTTRAEEKAAAPVEKNEKAKEKDEAKEKGAAQKEKKDKQEKKAAEEKKAGSDGGGVQGW